MVSILFLWSCRPATEKQTLIDAEWLIGTWKGVIEPSKVFYEKWSREGDTVFVNTNYHLENGDSIVGGRSKIALRNGKVYYINGLKDSSEVTWLATSFSPSKMVFENGGVKQYKTIVFELTEQNDWLARLVREKDTVHYSLSRVN